MEENKSLATEESVAAKEVAEEVVTEEATSKEIVEEVSVATDATAGDEVKKPSFGAKVKEWFRKKIVNLKRRPNNIPLVLYAITSVLYLIFLTTYSKIVYPLSERDSMSWSGLLVFINTLVSILVLVAFMNSFPKRKKPNIFFIILTAIMTLGMLGCDIGYYVILTGAGLEGSTYESLMQSSLNVTIVHIVLLAVCALAFALLPVYSKLIRKIDTSIKVESATESMAAGSIDIQED